MSSSGRILLAEDDRNLGALLVEYLGSEGLHVDLCDDGQKAFQAFSENSYDLCLLDVMMPEMDGFSLARAIRAKNKVVPIIFITAKFLKQDKLKGYDIGADDYITKPFDEEELLWKIKAVLRRANQQAVADSDEGEVVQLGKFRFDFKNQCLSCNEEEKRITEKESLILNYLYHHRNTVIKREEMVESLWGENDYFLGRSLDVFITKIRKYLKPDERLQIENVYGVGFIFKVPEKV